MHVALIAAKPMDSHGWGRYVRSLVGALAAHGGIEMTLITSTDAPPDAALPLRAYHRVLPSLTPAPRFSTARILSAMPRVRQLTAGCEVSHVIAEPYALLAPAALPLVVTAHGTYLPQTVSRRVTGRLYRRAYRRAQIICVSSYTERKVQAALPGAKTRIIPNGVDAERYRRRPDVLPQKSGPVILAVGQVKPRKGIHILAAALPRIRAVIPDAQAVIIGDTEADPGYVASIRAQAAADGVGDAIKFAGRITEESLLGWFHTADVFALPALNIGGRFEGFGLVYLEASAAGLPVIGTHDCGAEDAIRNGETGFLVPQGDPAALAEAIIRLLRDPALRAQMGTAGAAFAAAQTWGRVAARVAEVYSTVL